MATTGHVTSTGSVHSASTSHVSGNRFASVAKDLGIRPNPASGPVASHPEIVRENFAAQAA